MKVLAALLISACCFVLATTAKESTPDKEKRGIASSYTTPKNYASASAPSGAEVTYATAKVAPQTFAPSPKDYAQQQQQQYLKYVSQQPSAVQYQYEYDQQPHQIQNQQQITKLAPSKVAYAQAAPSPVHFSLASDVSSFSYTSPLVSYSNLGLLKQTIGKVAEAGNVPDASYTQPQAQQYTSDSKIAYAPQQYVNYPKQPQKVVLQASSAPQKLSYVAAAPVQKLQYAPVPQNLVYAQQSSAHAQPVHQQPSQHYKTVPQIVYASSPEEAYEKVYGKGYDRVSYVPQQVAYAEAPQQHQQQQPIHQQQQLVYQAQSPQQQVQFIKATFTPQQLAAYAQQLQQQHQGQHAQQAQQQQSHQQQQYIDAQTEQQPIYAIPQYYQSKYAPAGGPYSQQAQQH